MSIFGTRFLDGFPGMANRLQVRLESQRYWQVEKCSFCWWLEFELSCFFFYLTSKRTKYIYSYIYIWCYPLAKPLLGSSWWSVYLIYQIHMFKYHIMIKTYCGHHIYIYCIYIYIKIIQNIYGLNTLLDFWAAKLLAESVVGKSFVWRTG